MIIETMLQGSTEWQSARVGIPTSSNFDMVVTTKGEPSKQRTKYMYTLVAERITGVKEETYKNGAMQRGIEMEAEARALYEVATGNTVEQVGVCYPNEDKKYACSPDGLVNKDGALEIKCPTSAVHVGYLLNGGLPIDYLQQVQGQLLVTGLKFCDFVSYYPGLKPLIVRVKPDKSFLEALERELKTFCKELDEVTAKLKGI